MGQGAHYVGQLSQLLYKNLKKLKKGMLGLIWLFFKVVTEINFIILKCYLNKFHINITQV